MKSKPPELKHSSHLDLIKELGDLRSIREEYRLLLDEASDPIFAFYPDGRYRYVNEAFARGLGKKCIDITGKHISEVFTKDEADKRFAAVKSVFENGQIQILEMRVPRPAGDHFYVTSVKPIFDDRGQVVSVICISKDITERKVVEEKLLDSVRKLEEKELAKTRFLAAAGHDLRQPVAAANLFVDALKLTSPTPRQSELIARLDQSMSIFSGLLERLLDISKFDAGLVQPKIASFDLAGLFSWMEQNFAQSALDKELRFRLYFPLSRPLIVRTDIFLLQSVLMNLVTNAIKFTSRGGILISARQRGDKVLLQVWDTGIGIAETDLPHIFDEFYQVANPQRSREAGLGLGLSICQRAMSLLGGEVRCRSQLGRGTVFELNLPLNGKPHEIEPLSVKNASAEIANIHFLRGRRVVVVEDDALVAEGMCSLLQELGGEVRHFHSAEEALQHNDLTGANYFIVDYALGGKLSGIQFLEILQKRLNTPIRAVVVTGETSSQFISRIKNCPWPVLHKPISFGNLISLLSH